MNSEKSPQVQIDPFMYIMGVVCVIVGFCVLGWKINYCNNVSNEGERALNIFMVLVFVCGLICFITGTTF